MISFFCRFLQISRGLLIIFFFFSLIKGFSDALLVKELGSEDFLFQKGNVRDTQSPCSTFKIVLSLMGFDSKILADENFPIWTYEGIEPLEFEKWKGPHCPRSWLKDSCIWYSQKLVEEMGEKNFRIIS